MTDKMKKNAEDYTEKIEKEYSADYIIEPSIDEKNKIYRYNILTKQKKSVCEITILLIFEEYKQHHTRGNATQKHYGVNIYSLDTDEEYRGQGHATKLLLYAVCRVFLLLFETKKIFFVKLDDATVGNQRRIKGHIYHKIGFTPTGIIELNMNRKDYMKGIDSGRDVTMEYLLTVIIPNYMMKGGASKQKTRKRKTKKNKRAL